MTNREIEHTYISNPELTLDANRMMIQSIIYNFILLAIVLAILGVLWLFIMSHSQGSKWDGMKWYAIPGLPLAGTGMAIISLLAP